MLAGFVAQCTHLLSTLLPIINTAGRNTSSSLALLHFGIPSHRFFSRALITLLNLRNASTFGDDNVDGAVCCWPLDGLGFWPLLGSKCEPNNNYKIINVLPICTCGRVYNSQCVNVARNMFVIYEQYAL